MKVEKNFHLASTFIILKDYKKLLAQKMFSFFQSKIENVARGDNSPNRKMLEKIKSLLSIFLWQKIDQSFLRHYFFQQVLDSLIFNLFGSIIA